MEVNVLNFATAEEKKHTRLTYAQLLLAFYTHTTPVLLHLPKRLHIAISRGALLE